MSNKHVLTPELMLSMPRPQVAQVAPGSDMFLQASSTYDFDTEKTTRSLHIGSATDASAFKQLDLGADLEIASGEALWLNKSTVLFLRSEGKEAKGIEVWAKELDGEAYRVGSVPVKISNLSVNARQQDKALLLFSATVAIADPRLEAVEEQREKEHKAVKGGKGHVYDALWPRLWDKWVDTKTIQQLFAVQLQRKDGRRSFNGSFLTPLAGSKLECPIPPFGGSEEYDVSPDGKQIVFTAKHPDLNPARHTNQPIYLVSLASTASEPKMISTGEHGATTSPNFSPDGSKIAWLQMSIDSYEADRNRIVIYSVKESSIVEEDLAASWTRSPGQIKWSSDGQTLYALADDLGRRKLFSISVAGKKEPVALTHEHSVSGFSVLSADKLLITKSSFTSPNEIFVLSLPSGSLETVGSLGSAPAGTDGGETIWFDGARTKVQAHIVRPPGFDAKKSWPVVFVIHGGPQVALNDSWNTRWNLATFAAQGYVVVAPNITGSTGFGQDFVDAINQDWTGAPYEDLKRLVAHVFKTYPELDATRTIGAGASYAAFLLNYVNGKPLGFKAHVVHDGAINAMNNYLAKDTLYFTEYDTGGTPWEHPEKYAKISPYTNVDNWSTPTLVIHSERDYRVPISEGLGNFTILQRKGIPSRLVVFEEENHWVLNPANNLQWHKEVFRWMEEWAPSGPRNR